MIQAVIPKTLPNDSNMAGSHTLHSLSWTHSAYECADAALPHPGPNIVPAVSYWPGASSHQVHVPLVPIVAVGAAPEYWDNASAACSWPQCGLLDRASSLLLRGDASRDSSVVLFFSGGS